MGLSLQVDGNSSTFLAPLWERARGKFWALQHLLRSHTALGPRLYLMNTLVGQCALWCVAGIMPEREALKKVNSLQQVFTVWCMRLSKRAAEPWNEYFLRAHRCARAALHTHKIPRWSQVWLLRWWDFMGHVARAALHTFPPASSLLCTFRDSVWWKEQQGLASGERHHGRFHAKLCPMDEHMSTTVGARWQSAAVDKGLWKLKRKLWLDTMDVEWCSGNQLALEL